VLPPGPSAPRLSQTLQYGFRPYPFFLGAQRRHGDVFTVKVQEETWVMVADPEGVRTVLTADPEQTLSGEANLALRPLIGTRNVLLLDGPEHLRRRKLLLPPFHGERLAGYRAVMAQVAREEAARWPRGESFPLLPRMQSITFEVILRTVFGAGAGEAGALRAALRDLLDWLTGLRGMFAFVLLRPEGLERLPPFRRRLAAVDREIAAQIARRSEDPGEDILSLLLATDGLTERDVRDELLTLLVAGHETTTAALAWAWEAALRHEDARRALAAREPGWAAAVAHEALRLRPPVPLVVRRLLAPLEVGGHVLPAGATATPSTILLHRNAELYPDPHAFRPERWLDGAKPGTYTWIPFGGSTRRCLGASFAMLEIQTVLEEVAAAVTLRAPEPAHERVWRRGIVLVPARGAQAVI
jgi:cytochrome P450 family 135